MLCRDKLVPRMYEGDKTETREAAERKAKKGIALRENEDIVLP